MASKPISVSISVQKIGGERPCSIEVSSRAYRAKLWTVQRRRTQRGPSSPIGLTWSAPVSGVTVWQYLVDARTTDNPQFRSFHFLEAHPSDEGGQH